MFLLKMICCGLSLESPHGGNSNEYPHRRGNSNEQPQHISNSNEYPQHNMFLWRTQENFPYLK